MVSYQSGKIHLQGLRSEIYFYDRPIGICVPRK